MSAIKLGKHQQNLLNFAKKYQDKWHTYKNDYQTARVVNSLASKNLIKINELQQFKFVG